MSCLRPRGDHLDPRLWRRGHPDREVHVMEFDDEGTLLERICKCGPVCAACGGLRREYAPAERMDVETLARALVLAVPGYGRWMAYGRGTESGHDWGARTDAMLSEARVHAVAITRALSAMSEDG